MILTRDKIRGENTATLENWLIEHELLEGYIKYYKSCYSLTTSYIIEPRFVESYLDTHHWIAEDEMDYIMNMVLKDHNYVLGAMAMIELDVGFEQLAEYWDDEAEYEEQEYNMSYQRFYHLVETYNEVKGLEDE